MDIVRKLIICVILGAFCVSTVSAYEFHDPYPNVKVIDGEVHIQRPGGGTTLAYPNVGISKEIPVNTSKGNYLVPVEKNLPVVPSKVGKAATRFVRSLPIIGTGLAIYDTLCDIGNICVEDGALVIPGSDHVIFSQGQSASCDNVPLNGSAFNHPSSTFFYEYTRICGSAPPAPWGYTFQCSSSSECPLPSQHRVYQRQVGSVPPVLSSRPPEESDWTAAETNLNAQPQQTATALYNSDAPVPVDASTQSAPVTQQISQASTQTKDALGNITGTQTATTTVTVTDTSTTNNVTYNITETTTITHFNENNEITGTETSTSDNQPPKRTDETTISFDDVPPAQLEEEQPEFNLEAPESWGEGTCPPDEILTVQGVTFPVSWQPACDTAVQLRPIFVLFASVAAMFIVAGISRAGT